MPPRSRPASRNANAFHPPNDAATYRDVLMFEERLKTTALSLQSRKKRYQFFLLQLLLAIAVLLWEVLLPPQASLLVIPYRAVLRWVWPRAADEAEVHPYISSGLLFVSVTTLLLFFASGMYSEKIAYANKYVPHANRALRSFNMVLNVRKPPLRNQFAWNPLNFFFPRPPAPPHSSSSTESPSMRSRSPSLDRSPRSRSSSVSRPMASLPPSSNPRGELVFSSKVDKNFREGYERYRATFERKRAERMMAERRKGWMGWVWGLVDRGTASSGSPPSNAGAAAVDGGGGTAPPSRSGSVSLGSGRKPGQRSVTPTSESGMGIIMKTQRSTTPTGASSPDRPASRRENSMRTLALERSLNNSNSPSRLSE